MSEVRHLGGLVSVAAWKPEPWLHTGEMCYGNKGLVHLMNPACLSAWFFSCTIVVQIRKRKCSQPVVRLE